MEYRVGESPPAKYKARKQESDLKGYQWPASKLDVEDMEMLSQLRAETKKPITVLLHEAVEALYAATMVPDQIR